MIFLLIGLSCFEPLPPGGISSGVLAQAALVAPELGGINPAVLPRLSGWEIRFSYVSLYGLPELSTHRLNLSRLGRSPLAVELIHFGGEIYQEQWLGIGSGIELGPKVSVGVGLRGMRVWVKGYGSDGLFSLYLGALYLGPRVQIGGVVTNLNRPHLSSGDGLEVSTLLSLGVRPGPGLLLVGELSRDRSGEGRCLGAELALIPGIRLRLGMGQNPTVLAGGLGLGHKRLRADYGYRYHPRLGGSHILSLGFGDSGPN